MIADRADFFWVENRFKLRDLMNLPEEDESVANVSILGLKKSVRSTLGWN